MGAYHSRDDGPVHVAVVMPAKGNKILKSKFVMESPLPGTTVQEYFDNVIRSMLPNGSDGKPACGALISAGVITRRSSEEIEVSELNDECMLYVGLSLVKVVFYVETPDIDLPRPTARPVGEVLRPQPRLTLPTWTHAGRPALTKLFAELSGQLTQAGLGFYDSRDLKLGCEWMLELVRLLYKLSPFHKKLKDRGHPIPKAFQFSEGADDYKKKGKPTPMLTQDVLDQVGSNAKDLTPLMEHCIGIYSSL